MQTRTTVRDSLPFLTKLTSSFFSMSSSVATDARAMYRPDIDGLRAIAVLGVVAFHAFPSWMPGGFIGVDVFFVISGYLITRIIHDGLSAGSFSFSDFYARRIRRIFPALFLVLTAVYICGWLLLMPSEYKQLGKHIAAGAGFVSNIALWTESGYFDAAAETKPLLHLWSLGIEEQFYLLWPFVLWFSWKKRFNALLVAWSILLLSFASNIGTLTVSQEAAFYFPHSRLWELLIGAVLALRGPSSHSAFRANQLSLAGAVLLLLGFYAIDSNSSFPGYLALLPVLGTALLICSGHEAWINRRVLSNRVLVWIGLISFPLYLWHWPLLSFAQVAEGQFPSRSFRISAVLAAVLLAYLTYQFIEKPVRYGASRRAKTWICFVLVMIIGGIGYATYIQNGFAFRMKSNLAMDEHAIEQERLKYWAEGSWDKNFDTGSPRILVFGDSQGFDVFKALANSPSLGVKNYESSYDCTAFYLPIQGKENQGAMCRELYQRLFVSGDLKRADLLIYTFSWSKEAEPTDAFEHYRHAVQEILAVNPNIRIAFLGPKPLLGKKWVSINTIIKDQKSSVGLNGFLNDVKWIRSPDIAHARQIAAELGVAFVDIVDVYCQDACPFYRDDQFAYFDQNHWTGFGARLFYNRLVDSGELARLLRQK